MSKTRRLLLLFGIWALLSVNAGAQDTTATPTVTSKSKPFELGLPTAELAVLKRGPDRLFFPGFYAGLNLNKFQLGVGGVLQGKSTPTGRVGTYLHWNFTDTANHGWTPFLAIQVAWVQETAGDWVRVYAGPGIAHWFRKDPDHPGSLKVTLSPLVDFRSGGAALGVSVQCSIGVGIGLPKPKPKKKSETES